MNFNLIECCGNRLDNGELVYGAYVPNYTLDDPSEAGWIVDREYGIQYPIDPKTVKFVRESEKDEECVQCVHFTPATATSKEECYYEFYCKISKPNRFKQKNNSFTKKA